MNAYQKYFVWLIALLICHNIYGHNPQETYSTLEVQDEKLIFHLELPWSLSKAVLKEFPEWNENLDKASMKELTKEYILDNIELTKGGIPIQPINIELGAGAHSHSLSVLLEFKLVDYANVRIKNSLLFNLYPKQKNYHQLKFLDGDKKRFVTSKERPVFITDEIVLSNVFPTRIKTLLFTIFIGVVFLVCYNFKSQLI